MKYQAFVTNGKTILTLGLNQLTNQEEWSQWQDGIEPKQGFKPIYFDDIREALKRARDQAKHYNLNSIASWSAYTTKQRFIPIPEEDRHASPD
jgi:hypothetical protein